MLKRGFLALCGTVALGSFTWAAEHPRFVSQPLAGTILVDGHHDDWTGTVESFGAEPVSIQVENDAAFLYLRLVASDPAARSQIMRRGLTVWFDEQGKTKKRFGLEYPVVEGGGAADDRGRYGGRRGSGGSGSGAADRPADESYHPADRIEILSSNKDDERSLTLDHAGGIEAAMRLDQGTLRYELKVPLARNSDHPYAIGTAPGKTIGIGIETPKLERPSSGAGSGGGYGGGGYGGHGGGRTGGMGGRGGMHDGSGQRDYQPPRPLNAWGTLVLSALPDRSR